MSSVDSGENDTVYRVVVNHEEQYSIWPEHREIPLGWSVDGVSGSKAECLKHIEEVWTDMRPLSLRRAMEAAAAAPADPPFQAGEDEQGESLVSRLSTGDHRVEIGLRPERSVRAFEEALERGLVLVKFVDTQGGTELGVRIDRAQCDFAKANLAAGTGIAHLEGTLTLDYAKVRCIADIDLAGLSGNGRLCVLA